MQKLWSRLRRKAPSKPEVNSGIPVEGATSVEPMSLESMVQQYIREAIATDVSRESGEEVESWEEANDFEEEDPDTIPLTHHQVEAMSDLELREEAANYGVTIADDPLPTPRVDPTRPTEAPKPSNESGSVPASGSSGG